MKKFPKISIQWSTIRHFLPILAAFVIGLGVSIAAWYAVSVRDDRLAELEFNARAKSHALIFQSDINDYAEKIAAICALLEASPHVLREEFGFFTDRLLRRESAILRVSWTPRVNRGERSAHEQEAARGGLTGYRIHDLAPRGTLAPSQERDEYFPVFFSTGIGMSSSVYGLDIGSEPVRRQALDRARDTGEMATAPNIVLSTITGEGLGFFVTLPVYRRGAPHDTLEDRRRNLMGFVNGVFQAGVMIETILATTVAPAGLDLYFFGANDVPIYFHSSRARLVPIKPQPRAALAHGLHWSNEITVGGDRWTFVATTIPGGPGTATHGRAWIVLIAGVLVSGLVVAYMWTSVRHANRLEVANKSLDAALNNMSEGLCMFDREHRVVVSNDRYLAMYGLSAEQARPGIAFSDLLQHRVEQGSYPTGPKPDEYIAELIESFRRGSAWTKVTKLPDGRFVAVSNSAMLGGGWVATHADITEQRRTEARIAHMAHHDSLTDLPNRRLLRERLEEAISQASRHEGVAVLCLDLDRFKQVNDTLGHPVGDGLLKSVAERLRGCVRDTDTVARLGGDEFAIIQIGSNQPMDAAALATRIIDAISAPHNLNHQDVEVCASIGIAVSPTDGTGSDELLRNADLALYRAKKDGRGKHRFFEKGMDERMRARGTLERDLRKALSNGEFELHYQPLINLQRNELAGFEALLRWNHPERGKVAPVDFVPLAEEIGLIVPIGAWVLRQACAEAAGWPAHINVAVNLSSAQFKGQNLVATVFNALSTSGLDAGRLELEITESVLLMDSAPTLAMLRELRELGARISMDDFGTGYSSLSYLQSFPFDKIKIDQSFIQNINENSHSLAIVHAIIGLGVSLGMETTAEGVETVEQLDRVRAEGCTEAQGYYFSMPKPANEVAALLSSMGRKRELAA